MSHPINLLSIGSYLWNDEVSFDKHEPLDWSHFQILVSPLTQLCDHNAHELQHRGALLHLYLGLHMTSIPVLIGDLDELLLVKLCLL